MSVVKCDKCAPLKYESLIEAADYIKTKISFTPKVGIICGTGLGMYTKILKTFFNYLKYCLKYSNFKKCKINH